MQHNYQVTQQQGKEIRFLNMADNHKDSGFAANFYGAVLADQLECKVESLSVYGISHIEESLVRLADIHGCGYAFVIDVNNPNGHFCLVSCTRRKNFPHALTSTWSNSLDFLVSGFSSAGGKVVRRTAAAH